MIKITTEMLHNPRWYETIMLKSGNLEGDERISFIDRISEQNLYLAAKCKNSSFEQEQDLVKRLLRKAKKETEDMNHAKNAAQGILTLAEFACEKEIVKLTLNLKLEKLLAIYEAIDNFGLKPPMILSDLLALKTPIYNYDYSYEFTYDYEHETIKRIYKMTRHHIPNFQKISSLVKQIIYEDKAFTLNLNSYNTLINKAQTYQQGFELFEEMKNAGLKLDEISYSTLINKAETYQQGFDLFQEMKNAGLTPNEISYNTLINKAQTYQQGFDLFEEMKKAGLKLDEISYNTLINKAQTYQQGFDLFEEMKKAGLTPNVVTFNTLLKKATRHQQPLQVFLSLLDEMIHLKIKPQVGGTNKRGKTIKPYTVFAVQNKLRQNQIPYKEWVLKKREPLEKAPRWLQTAWAEFFRQTVQD